MQNWIFNLGILCLLLVGQHMLYSQPAIQRKVFSAGGGTGTIGLQTYAYTFGETIIGTDMANLPILTRGFHQPVIESPLNANLEYFTAVLAGDDALLQWQFAGFPFPMTFEVERRGPDTDFEGIGMLEVDPDGQVLGDFSFSDIGIVFHPNQRAYYRIRSFFPDGSFSVSNTVELTWERSTHFSLLAYPNPTQDHLNVVFDLEADGPVEFRLLNALGQQIHIEQVEGRIGKMVHQLNLQNFPEGIYVLSVQRSGKVDELMVRVMH